MRFFFIILLSFKTLGAQAARDPKEGPAFKAVNCQQNKIQACVQGHREQVLFIERRIQQLVQKEGYLNSDREIGEKHLRMQLSELSSLRASSSLAKLEIEQDLNTSVSPASDPIFPFGPKPEEILPLHHEIQNWGELHTESRKLLLRISRNHAEHRISEKHPISQNLATNLTEISRELLAITAEKSGLEVTLFQHQSMVNGGCKQSLCQEY